MLTRSFDERSEALKRADRRSRTACITPVSLSPRDGVLSIHLPGELLGAGSGE